MHCIGHGDTGENRFYRFGHQSLQGIAFKRHLHAGHFHQHRGMAGGDDAKLTALLATQCEQAAGFGGSTAWLAVADAADVDIDWTCDRRELFDARARALLPDHLGQRAGAGLDPCAALSLPLRLVGITLDAVFSLLRAVLLLPARLLGHKP